jgi:hypothetical protein
VKAIVDSGYWFYNSEKEPMNQIEFISILQKVLFCKKHESEGCCLLGFLVSTLEIHCGPENCLSYEHTFSIGFSR